MLAALTNPRRRVRAIWATEGNLADITTAQARSAGVCPARPKAEVVERVVIDRLVPTGAVHQGIAAQVLPLEWGDISDVTADPQADTRLIVLDQVTDPQNVGAVLRAAAAFAAAAVVLTKRHAPEETGALAKAASGALEVTPLIRVGNLSRSLALLRLANFQVIGLCEDAGLCLSAISATGPLALVLGGEGTGLRRLSQEGCTQLARLPTHAPISSLNVATAAAVALYAVRRQ